MATRPFKEPNASSNPSSRGRRGNRSKQSHQDIRVLPLSGPRERPETDKGSNPISKPATGIEKPTYASALLFGLSKKGVVARVNSKASHLQRPGSVISDASQWPLTGKDPAVIRKSSVLPAVPIKAQNTKFGSIDDSGATLLTTSTALSIARNPKQIKTTDKDSNSISKPATGIEKPTYASALSLGLSKKGVVTRVNSNASRLRRPDSVISDVSQWPLPGTDPAVIRKSSVLPAVPIKAQNTKFGSIDDSGATLLTTSTTLSIARNPKQIKTFASISVGDVDVPPAVPIKAQNTKFGSIDDSGATLLTISTAPSIARNLKQIETFASISVGDVDVPPAAPIKAQNTKFGSIDDSGATLLTTSTALSIARNLKQIKTFASISVGDVDVPPAVPIKAQNTKFGSIDDSGATLLTTSTAPSIARNLKQIETFASISVGDVDVPPEGNIITPLPVARHETWVPMWYPRTSEQHYIRSFDAGSDGVRPRGVAQGDPQLNGALSKGDLMFSSGSTASFENQFAGHFPLAGSIENGPWYYPWSYPWSYSDGMPWGPAATRTPPTTQEITGVGDMGVPPEGNVITPAATRNPPTAQEIIGAADLTKELHAQGAFETAEGSQKREEILKHLPKLVDSAYEAFARKYLSEGAPLSVGCKIFTFGSYRLGVHGPGSDIDVLITAPEHVGRQDFIEIMLDILQNDLWVTEARSEAYALVPIIMTKIRGIRVDFAFARLALSIIPDNLELSDDALYKDLDEKCLRSLNGPRCADEILRLVPVVHVFRDALRAIKFWAQRRAIYSNMSGFLGGVAWAILVAHICQLYPNGNMATIVRQFFWVMSKWKWPQPVMLQKVEDGHLNVRAWNPERYPSDGRDKMPIITPVRPSMCSTRNVMACTLKIVKEEIARGRDITTRALSSEMQWSLLFEKHDFFTKYRHYLQVIASSCDKVEQLKWVAMVQSKIRHLAAKLEKVDRLAQIHPFIKGFDKVYYTINTQERDNAALGNISAIVASRKEKDVGTKASPDLIAVHTTAYYVGLEITKLDPAKVNEEARNLDISVPVNDFLKLVKSWGSCRIAVRHLKNSAPPERESERAGISPRSARPPNVVMKGDSHQQAQSPASPGLSTGEQRSINPSVINTNDQQGHRQERSDVKPDSEPLSTSEYIEDLAPLNIDPRPFSTGVQEIHDSLVDPWSHCSTDDTSIEGPINDTLPSSTSSELNPHAFWLPPYSSIPSANRRPLNPPNILKKELKFVGKAIKGTYSEVCFAEWNGKMVAVKILYRLKVSEHAMERKLKRELRVWWELAHPSILPLLGFVEDIGEMGAMVSPFCQHKTISEYLEKTPLAYFPRIFLWLQVIEGMTFLHGYYPMIIHGDLKPANILIDEDGQARICDFGLARLVGDHRNTTDTTTEYTGTTRYKSPELFLGNMKQTVASDVYALGCLGLEVVLSICPFEWCVDEKAIEREKGLCQPPAKKPPAKRPGKPPQDVEDFWELLYACWNMVATERPTTTSICQFVRRHGTALAEELGKEEVVKTTSPPV